MAWMDFEKFQTRSGNEPRAAALERKIANEWMGAGYTPSVIPHWRKGFTTEHPGVSPGGGNARTYQTPDEFSYSVVPEPDRKIPSFQDLMKMWQGEEEENLAGGGIASLENRPGYAWGALVKGANFLKDYYGGGNESVPEPMKRLGKTFGPKDIDWSGYYHANEFTGASGPRHAGEFSDYERNSPFYNFSGEKDFFPGMSTQWMRNSALSDPGLQDDPTIRTQYDEDRSLNDLYWEGEFGTGIPRPRKNLARMYNPRMRADGGAVGLEPGIASLMGYAKGGMVTRVRVPKGQSKWMKKFINNMRDS